MKIFMVCQMMGEHFRVKHVALTIDIARGWVLAQGIPESYVILEGEVIAK